MADYLKKLREKTGHMPLVLPHSVVVLFNEDGKVLFEKRSDDGFYDFPGGGIDLKETGEEAAKRELFEETGLIADELELFNVYTGKVTHYVYFNGDEIYGVDLVYICHKWHGDLKPQKEEVSELVFLDIKDVPGNVSIRNKAIINDLLKR